MSVYCVNPLVENRLYFFSKSEVVFNLSWNLSVDVEGSGVSVQSCAIGGVQVSEK